MKKYLFVMILLLLLTGCSRAEVFETIADDNGSTVIAPQRLISVQLPEDAAVWTMQHEDATIYWCDGYELMLEVLPAGNLDETIQKVSGYRLQDLTVLNTESDGYSRYEFVWSSLEDQGDRIGRATILDDGKYHYILSVMANADDAADSMNQWNNLFGSYGLE